jgi:predicted alpha-1,6-mannanase (GH76 family)
MAAMLLAAACGAATAFAASEADVLLDAHTKAFVRVDQDRAWFRENTSSEETNSSFWMEAEQIEMELDACERTHSASQRDLCEKLFNGFIAEHGADWRTNDFNDDLMWMVIASARGYLLTGKEQLRDVAKSNFDVCFARSWSSDMGGGLWWKTDNRSKNACVNGPGAIAAALLSRACEEPAYLAKATNIFLWERANLFEPKSGHIFDNMRSNGRVSFKSFSYNQGTFIGAANLLGYTNEAMLAATYTMNHLCRDGLLPGYGETGDASGFNGICARWLARFMYDNHEEPVFEAWLRKNAEAAWNVRRASDNISWNLWSEPTPEGKRYSWGCSSSVVIQQALRPADTSR